MAGHLREHLKCHGLLPSCLVNSDQPFLLVVGRCALPFVVHHKFAAMCRARRLRVQRWKAKAWLELSEFTTLVAENDAFPKSSAGDACLLDAPQTVLRKEVVDNDDRIGRVEARLSTLSALSAQLSIPDAQPLR